jgi:Kef-type K+ transport system membrane component KefB
MAASVLPPNELARILAVMALILGTSRALGVVTRRLGQPMVVAETTAGILLGPSLLGWVAPGAFAWLFTPATLAGVKLLSQLGLVLFMFLVGLQLDPRLLRRRPHVPLLIGLASIVAPLTLGILVGGWLHPTFGEGYPRTAFVLFLGAALSLTAFPVLARILSEHRLLRSSVGTIALASAAVDDIGAWCLVAVVIAMVGASDLLSAAATTAASGVALVGAILLARPLLGRVVQRVERFGVRSGAVVAIVLPLLLVASASEMIGIHALFGAFLFGVLLPRSDVVSEVITDRLETVASSVLLPLFFAYSGLRTQLALVDQPADWVATAAIVAAAVVGKLGGGAIAGRVLGLAWRDAAAVGVLLNTRGMMALIVLNVGLDLGVVPPTIFAMLVVMSLVTTLLAAPLLSWLQPSPVGGAGALSPTDTPVVATAVEPRGADPEVVVAGISDRGSGGDLAALAHALVGHRGERARVLGLHLAEPTERVSEELRDAACETPEELETFVQRADELNLEATALEFVSAVPAEDIVRLAEAKRATVILLGSHQPWFVEDPLGGTVGDVLRLAPMSVVVLLGTVGGARTDGRRVVVHYTGPLDRPALDVARRLVAGGFEVTIADSSGAGVPSGPRWSVRAAREGMASVMTDLDPDLLIVSAGSYGRRGSAIAREARIHHETRRGRTLVVHDPRVAPLPRAAWRGLPGLQREGLAQ